MKNLIIFFVCLLSFNGVFGQITVSGSIGADGVYSSLTQAGGAFAAINATPQTGMNILVIITADVTTEDGVNSLNQGAWTSITINPQGTRVLSGTVVANPLINFNGADYVTINGLNTGGNSLTISNLSTSGTSGTSTIKFISDATNNTITNCSILGSSTMTVGTNGGNIWFAAGAVSTGNDNNTISNCSIGPAGSNLPTKCIYANGTATNATLNNSNNTITNNLIFDYFGAATNHAGIYISGGNNTWNITNNRLYQTATRTCTAAVQHRCICINNGASGEGFTITGNIIGYASAAGTGTYSLSSTGGAGEIFNGIYFSGLSTSVSNVIDNNIISDISITTGFLGDVMGSIMAGIDLANSADVISISNNTIRNIIIAGSGTGTFAAIELNSSGTGLHTVNLNTIINMSRSSAGNLYGIRIGAPTTITLIDNNISFLAVNNTAAATQLWGIYGGGSYLNLTATGNNINHLSSTSTTAIYVGGIRDFGGDGNKTFQNNLINNLSSGGAGYLYGLSILATSIPNPMTISGNTIHTFSGGLNEYGIIHASTSNICNIYQNKIYNFTSSNSNPSVNGIYLTTGVTTNVYNNLIGDLKTTAANAAIPLTGIYISGGTSTNLYYNTVYLNATSSGALFGSAGVYASTTTTLDMRNNIIVNTSTPKGTGKTAAYRRSNATLTTYATTSNNNLFFAGTPGAGNVIYYDGTNYDQDLTAYKTRVTPRDAVSISANPDWLSTTGNDATFLHINPTTLSDIESGGASIVSYSIDYDGDKRQGETGYSGTGTSPDIGADEFEGMQDIPCSGTPASCTVTAPISNCFGDSATLSLSTTYIQTGINYQWVYSAFPGGPYSSLGTLPTQATGVLGATSYYKCIITCANSGEFYITPEKEIYIAPLPVVNLGNDTTICADQSVVLDAGNPEEQHLWSPGSETSQMITADSVGHGIGTVTYIVVVSSNGCGSSDTINVTFDPCTGIGTVDDGISVSVVPNPSNGIFYLNVEGIYETVTLNIYSITGQTIYTEQLDKTGLVNKPVDLKLFPKGMYFLRLINNNMTHTEKIIIE